MIAYGLTYPTFSQLTKELFLDVAEQEFALPFKRQTDSRLALVTGISRKEISLFKRGRRDAAGGPDVEDSVVTHVIGRWMAGPPYATPDGVPCRLRYEGTESDAISFARLVRETGADIPVRAVLDELLRLGCVAFLPDGDVELRREVHIPAADAEGKSDPARLRSGGALQRPSCTTSSIPMSPWLQRKAVYDHIGADALAALREEAGRAGVDFVRRANALLASYDRDRHPEAPGGPRTRVVVGVYYFEEPIAAPDPPRAAPAPAPAPGRIRRPR